jgi:DnaJ-class molecular chaperone
VAILMSRPACDKCKGTGLVKREGAEADKDMHPILSERPTICDACGGSGYQPPAETRRAHVAGAAGMNG